MKRGNIFTEINRNTKKEINKTRITGFSLRYQITMFLVVIFFFGCTEKEDILTSPTITSNQISEITSKTATSGGNVISLDGSEILAKGACWSTTHKPTINDSKTIEGTGSGHFTSLLTGLFPKTTYYLRAYATNSLGTYYSDEMNFTTSDAPVTVPILATSAISEITSETASCGGNITSNGGKDIVAKGVCWSVTKTLTVDDFKTTDGTGMGNFTSLLTELLPNTTYYLRAYAANGLGINYGEEISFTTNKAPVFVPTITTTVASEIGSETALSGGNVTSDGGSAITARGVCWSIYNTPGTNDSKSVDGEGIGSFTSSLSGLLPNTTYYLRAYATNDIGTSYGEEVGFTTGNNIYSGNLYFTNQQEVDDFESMGYTKVTGDVLIEPALPTPFSNLNGLSSIRSIGGALIISKTKGLKNLSGLRNLTTVGDFIILSHNQELTSIGLESLSSVGKYLNILLNENLTNLDGLSKLSSSEGKPNLTIWNNIKLNDFCGIKPLLSDFTGIFSVKSNLINPTQQEIIESDCGQ